jgi:hypothetical protein
MAIDTMKTPTVVRFQKQSCITADNDPLFCEISIYRDVTGRYPSMVNQTIHQKQTNTPHSSWIKSEYNGDRYNDIADGGSDGKEKLHHSR